MKNTIIQISKFLLVGCLNTVIGLSTIYSLMYFAGTTPLMANALGYLAGTLIGFFLNSIWTFGRRSLSEKSILKYVVGAVASYLSNIAVIHLIISKTTIDNYSAQLAGVCTYTLTMFILCRFYVFEPKDSNTTSPERDRL